MQNPRAQPRNIIESSLVKDMTVARWMRAWAMQKPLLSEEMQKQTLEDPETALDPATCAAVAFRALADTSRGLDALSRDEDCHFGQFERALDRLTRLRQAAEKK